MESLIKFNNYSLQERLDYSQRLVTKYPDYIPVILKKKENDKILRDIDRFKYLIPKNLNVDGLLFIIRKKIKPSEHQAIFIFAKQTTGSSTQSFLIPMNKTIGELYHEYKSSDNFLYIIFTTENTFG